MEYILFLSSMNLEDYLVLLGILTFFEPSNQGERVITGNLKGEFLKFVF